VAPYRAHSSKNGCGVSSGIATMTGSPARAPYAASAPAALPADGAENFLAPRCFAIDTAMAMPRALKEPVGLRASSFTQTLSSTASSGVKPSPSEVSSPSSNGSSSR
jgi:hypothetical protein